MVFFLELPQNSRAPRGASKILVVKNRVWGKNVNFRGPPQGGGLLKKTPCPPLQTKTFLSFSGLFEGKLCRFCMQKNFELPLFRKKIALNDFTRP